MISILSSHGARHDIQDNNGDTPLILAFNYSKQQRLGTQAIVAVISQAHGDVNIAGTKAPTIIIF